MDDVFKALADATRRVMLDKLLENPGQTLGQLVADTDMRRQSASKHLRILEKAGLVHVEWEGREKKHFLNPIPIREISSRWIDKFSAVRLDALLNLKEALETAPPSNQTASEPDTETGEDEEKRGPAITSFFTPLED